MVAKNGSTKYNCRRQTEVPKGLVEASKLPEPIFTPSSKEEVGDHDINISYAECERQIGAQLAAQVRDAAIALYKEAAAYALTKGIIICDTKFEFGLDENGVLTLMDEVLTPDSSRFWSVETYREGSQLGQSAAGGGQGLAEMHSLRRKIKTAIADIHSLSFCSFLNDFCPHQIVRVERAH